MKKLQTTGLLALAGLALFATSAKAQQTVNFNNGDLLLGFETSSGTGTDYELDIGSITKFSPTSSFTLNSTNTLGYGSPVTDLQNDFGSGTSWDSSSTLWGVIGNIDNNGTALGLPKNTIFATSPTDTAWGEQSSSHQSGFSTAIESITGENSPAAGTTYAGSTSTANSNLGVNQAVASDGQSWAAANPYGASTTYNSEGTQSFEAYSTIEGATTGNLELFEMQTTGGGHPGTQDIGTFSISNTGAITFTGSDFSAVPEPSTWASLFLAAGAIVVLGRRRGGLVKA